jgi:hypothetical protein
MACGVVIGRQDPGCGDKLFSPLFVLIATPGVSDSIAGLAKDDDRPFDRLCLDEDAHRCRFIVGHSGNGVGIEDHSQSSDSIFSNALFMIWLIREVSW